MRCYHKRVREDFKKQKDRRARIYLCPDCGRYVYAGNGWGIGQTGIRRYSPRSWEFKEAYSPQADGRFKQEGA